MAAGDEVALFVEEWPAPGPAGRRHHPCQGLVGGTAKEFLVYADTGGTAGDRPLEARVIDADDLPEDSLEVKHLKDSTDNAGKALGWRSDGTAAAIDVGDGDGTGADR